VEMAESTFEIIMASIHDNADSATRTCGGALIQSDRINGVVQIKTLTCSGREGLF